MRKLQLVLVAFLFACAALAQEYVTIGDYTFTQQQGDWYAVDQDQLFKVDPSHVIVKFKHPKKRTAINAMLSQRLLTLKSRNSLGFEQMSFKDMDVVELISVLEKDPLVESVEPNVEVKFQTTIADDDLYPSQWYHNNPSGYSLRTPRAWDFARGTSSVVIGLVETGVDLQSDIGPNDWENPNDPYDKLDNDGNGFVDDTNGWNFANNNANLSDPDGHGTATGGVISAWTNTGDVAGHTWADIAGVAGGWCPSYAGASLMVLKVGDTPYADFVDTALGYARANNADLINMSLTTLETPSLRARLEQVFPDSIAMVVGSGNNFYAMMLFPATDPHTIAVGNATQNGRRYTGFEQSAYGYHLDLMAPGTDILTLAPGYDTTIVSGTSLAAPLASGVLALLKERIPTAGPIRLKQILCETC